MNEVYRCEVNTRPPRIAYRETITANAEAAKQIAKIQREAADEIDRRTRSMAGLNGTAPN